MFSPPFQKWIPLGRLWPRARLREHIVKSLALASRPWPRAFQFLASRGSVFECRSLASDFFLSLALISSLVFSTPPRSFHLQFKSKTRLKSCIWGLDFVTDLAQVGESKVHCLLQHSISKYNNPHEDFP